MANRFVFPNVQRFDANGNPGAGWKLAFYKPGTSTEKDTYSDADLTTPNTNPVIANADGVWPDIWMDGTYDVRLLDADDVQQDSWNSVKGPIFAAVGSGAADGVPTNAYIGSFVPDILDGGTDAYTVSAGRAVGTGETFTGDVGSANTTTTPTLDNTDGASGALTVTTRDGSALWAGALSGVHTFQKAASSWKVRDPNPVIPDSTTQTGADATLVSGTAGTSGNLAQWNVDGDVVDSGVATSATLRNPGTSSTPALAFNTYRTPNASRVTWVVVTVVVSSDGTTNGEVRAEVDESGGTTADYYFHEIKAAVDTSGSGSTRGNFSFPIPPGASYRIANTSDPNTANAIDAHREFTL